MREIIFYESDFGDKPVEEFVASLDAAVRAKVLRTLELLRTQQIVPSKFWKKLSGSDLWEVRVEYAGNIYRVLAVLVKNNRVILLHAFQKKSQKTPRQDIWKLLCRGRSGIFSGTAICERRPSKLPRQKHGVGSALRDCATTPRSWGGRGAAARAGRPYP